MSPPTHLVVSPVFCDPVVFPVALTGDSLVFAEIVRSLTTSGRSGWSGPVRSSVTRSPLRHHGSCGRPCRGAGARGGQGWDVLRCRSLLCRAHFAALVSDRRPSRVLYGSRAVSVGAPRPKVRAPWLPVCTSIYYQLSMLHGHEIFTG